MINIKLDISTKQSKRNVWLSVCAGLLFRSQGCGSQASDKLVTLETLLDEMVSVEGQAPYPVPSYTCCQENSYDRASVSPDSAGWFANSDGSGIKRVNTIAGRIEKVMFDEVGPGVITRIWITTIDKRGTWRSHSDDFDQPGWITPAYDLMRINVPGLGKGMLQAHTSYTSEGKGGNIPFLPIPYARGCKVMFEDGPGVNPTPKHYYINFRKYPEGTQVEAFPKEAVERVAQRIVKVGDCLSHPTAERKGEVIRENKSLPSSDLLTTPLPTGENAVYEAELNTRVDDPEQYVQLTRELVFNATFDGKQIVWVPLNDFSGGGMSAPKVDSWYPTSGGKGNIPSRWLMPYCKPGVSKVLNPSPQPVDAELEVNVAPLRWNKDWSLYFYASWRQENGIYIHDKSEEADQCVGQNFATLRGKGVYKGDLLSLYGHVPLQYGEDDEKIWVDDDTFPSHFGTGTEDYYNGSWVSVVPLYTPFRGALRADLESSHDYNAFYRTRHLDGIPFNKSFKLDIEMLGRKRGEVDYAITIYWHGDPGARVLGTSGIEEARRQLLPAVEASVN